MNSSDANTDAQRHYLEASVDYESAEYEKALDKSNLAIACDPEYSDAYNLRGAIQEEMGLQTAAMLDYREAIRLDPGFQEAKQNLLELELDYFGFMRPGWVFFILWVLIYTLSMGVIPNIISRLFSEDLVQWIQQGKLIAVYTAGLLIRGVTVGALASALQLGLLRGRVNPGRWLLASTLGIVAADASSILFSFIGGGITWAYLLDIVLPGTIIGLIQWPVISERIQQAGWWPLVTTVAWFLASMTAPFLNSFRLGIIDFGLVFGAGTGVGLMWLCRQPANELFFAEEVMEE